MGVLGTIAYLYKKDILAHYGGCCVYCGRQLTLKETELDHVVAATKGGLNTKRNIVPSCMPCNRKKNNNPPPIPIQLPLNIVGWTIYPKVYIPARGYHVY